MTPQTNSVLPAERLAKSPGLGPGSRFLPIMLPKTWFPTPLALVKGHTLCHAGNDILGPGHGAVEAL